MKGKTICPGQWFASLIWCEDNHVAAYPPQLLRQDRQHLRDAYWASNVAVWTLSSWAGVVLAAILSLAQ